MTVTFPVPNSLNCEKISCLLVEDDAAMGVGPSTRRPGSNHVGIVRGAQEWHGVQAEQTTVGFVPCMLPSTAGLMVR